METNRQDLNRQLAQMLKGGVIMDVTTPEQARIASYRRGRRCLRRDGPRTYPSRYPCRWWRLPHE